MYIFNKQRVAIIGATGQVGTPLTKALLFLGHDVVVLARSLDNHRKRCCPENNFITSFLVDNLPLDSLMFFEDLLEDQSGEMGEICKTA